MNWYYANMNSPRQGPLDEVEIYRLITEKAINASTLVWNETLPDWKKLSETEFASHLGKSSPPPLPAIIETPNAEPVVIAHPPIRKDNEPSRTERLSVRSIFWMLVGIFILGSVGLFIFQHRSDLKLIVAQSWSIGAAAGGQAALDQYHADKAGSAPTPYPTPTHTSDTVEYVGNCAIGGTNTVLTLVMENFKKGASGEISFTGYENYGNLHIPYNSF
jgi:hypothetical protein